MTMRSALILVFALAACDGASGVGDGGVGGDGGGGDLAMNANPDLVALADMSRPADLGPGVQTPRPKGTTASTLGYYEYLPPTYGLGASPLMVFLHGIAEGGDGTTQLPRVLNNGPPKLIAGGKWPSARPFVVLSPQHPDTTSCFTATEIRDFIAYALAHYTVDPKRVYLTGLSCGAIGAWNYLGTDQSKVAAAVLIAGDGNGAWAQAGCNLGQVALWAFHGDADPTVNVSGTTTPINNLLTKCPSPPRLETKMTIYPGVGHDSWTRTYDLSAGHDIYTWMLGFQKP